MSSYPRNDKQLDGGIKDMEQRRGKEVREGRGRGGRGRAKTWADGFALPLPPHACGDIGDAAQNLPQSVELARGICVQFGT